MKTLRLFRASISRLPILVLIVIAALSVVGSVISAYHALTSTPADASGWWQVVVSALELPVIIFALYSLPGILVRARWKPEIEIGLAACRALSYIPIDRRLPTFVEVSQGYTCFSLVVRNSGKLAARYVKMHLEYTSFDEEGDNPITRTIRIIVPENNPFFWQNNKDYLFTGGNDWVIYPQDMAMFTFHISTAIEGYAPAARDYHFKCKVWAEGLDQPVEEALIVRIQKSDSVNRDLSDWDRL